MNRARADLYLPQFTGDEMTLVVSECRRPWACSCNSTDPECGLTPSEAKMEFVKYYHEKASHYAAISDDEFMTELGFYTYQK